MKFKKIISPKKMSGAMFWSTALHLSIALGVIISNLISPNVAQIDENYLDLGYEIYDAPPDMQEKVNLARKAAEVQPQVKTDAPADAVRELQDESSDIKGNQKEVKAQDTGVAGTVIAAAPYYKIKPKYPKAALISGEEGWVLFSVDVTETGEVENLRVVDGEKKDVFQLEARRALSKWKYRPFVDGSGQPVRKRDHLVKVEFKLEESGSI